MIPQVCSINLTELSASNFFLNFDVFFGNVQVFFFYFRLLNSAHFLHTCSLECCGGAHNNIKLQRHDFNTKHDFSSARYRTTWFCFLNFTGVSHAYLILMCVCVCVCVLRRKKNLPTCRSRQHASVLNPRSQSASHHETPVRL